MSFTGTPLIKLKTHLSSLDLHDCIINSNDLVKVGLFVLGNSLCNHHNVHSNATLLLLHICALKSESLRIIIIF